VRKSGGLGAATLRAWVLLRARWRAAVGFGLVAGLGAGGVIGLLTIARDTGSSLDRYVRSLHGPDVVVTVCPPGVDAAGPDASKCLRHNPVDELEAVRQHPDVAGAGRLSPTPLLARSSSNSWAPAFGWVSYDGLKIFGTPHVVAGHRADPAAADQAEVSEAMARAFHLGVGSRLDVAPLSWAQFDSAEVAPTPALPVQSLRITGIVRVPSDLAASESQGAAARLYGEMVFLGPGWVKAVGEERFASFLTGIGLDLRPGGSAQAALDWAAPGQTRSIQTGLATTDVSDTRETVAYEARAATAAAVLLLIAVAVLIGQMIARQARREISDAGPLRALGMSRRQVLLSAVPRWLFSVAVTLVVAAVTAAFVRSLGPIGVARRAVARPGPSWDVGVLAAGLLLTLVFMLAVALLATVVAGRAGSAANSRGRPLPVSLPVSPMVGLALTGRTTTSRWAPRVAAVLGSAVAVAAVVATPTLTASLQHLVKHPQRFGVAWDALVSGPTGPASAANIAEGLAKVDGIAAVAGLLGNTAHIGDHELYVYTLEPVPGLPSGIAPTITRGRAPVAADEIALGSRTLASVGAKLGDTIKLNYLDDDRELRVVGEVVVNDGYEPVPGRGAVVTPEWLRSVDAAGFVSDFAVRFRPEAREKGIAALQAAFPGWTAPAYQPRSIADLQRISGWPPLLAGLTAAMAVVAFVHALVTSVRERRRQLAVLKALGSSRRQVGAGVLWHASFLALPAILIGVPLGVIVGRAGWAVFERNVGVVSGPIVSPLSLVLISAIALLITNALAVWPSWRAAHLRTADALRSE
jgi:putative ABC transport system permease protein